MPPPTMPASRHRCNRRLTTRVRAYPPMRPANTFLPGAMRYVGHRPNKYRRPASADFREWLAWSGTARRLRRQQKAAHGFSGYAGAALAVLHFEARRRLPAGKRTTTMPGRIGQWKIRQFALLNCTQPIRGKSPAIEHNRALPEPAGRASARPPSRALAEDRAGLGNALLSTRSGEFTSAWRRAIAQRALTQHSPT